ncbi:UDP-3-O-(3-hydroxymyristoyl)glucosamine N-acyltransferase [Candidatus Dependentiae bacterium]|nr:UDP-3-O-(3-hydroxymyristoyl)glucosamine N-acyltransferase [Candidatus Dependentiae bacterium]
MNLNLTLQDIICLLDVVECHIEPSFLVKKIASLEQAGPDDIAIIMDRGDQSVFDAVSTEKIKQSNAGIFLASKAVVDGKRYLLVKDEVIAFQKLVDVIAQKVSENDPLIAPTAQVHPSAVIEQGATIGQHTFIGAQVVVGRDCQIGAGVVLHPGVKILDRCIIGDGTIIHAGAVIGSDGFGYQITKIGLRKIPQIGIVRVGKFVEIGANCTIDRASFDQTLIGNGVKIDNLVHIAHNVTIGDGCAILAQTGIAGSVTIGVGTQIGGQVAIKDNVVVGKGVKVVSKSGVMSNLVDGSTVAGIPSMPFLQWKRCMVALNKLPEVVKLAGDVKTLLEKQAGRRGIFGSISHFVKKIFN